MNNNNNDNNISVVSSEVWNNLDKPDECNEIAQQNDIVEYIDGVYFLCQRANNFNNIICLSSSSSSINHILAMFKFCVRLYKYYNIIYIRVEGNTKRYRFLEKIFPKDIVIKDESITDRNVYYCNIEKAHEKLKELSHYDETET